MAVTTLPVPAMYADHHVTAVRKALEALSGVEDIQASSASKQVTVKHGKPVTKKRIVDALSKAGYPSREEKHVDEEPSCFGDPSWYECAPRCIKTDPADV